MSTITLPIIAWSAALVGFGVAAVSLFLLYRQRRRSVSLAAYEVLIRDLSDPCGIVVDGRIVAVNPALSKLVNRDPEELVGKDTYAMLATFGVNLPSRETVREQTLRAGNQQFVVPFKAPRGEPGFAEFSVASIGTGKHWFVIFIRDVTRRVRDERALRQRNLQFEKAMEMTAFGAWVYDAKSDMQEWSEEMKEMFGVNTPILEEQFAKGPPRFSLMHVNDRHVGDLIMRCIEEGRDPPPLSFRIVRPDGDIRHIQAHVGRILDDSGDLSQIVGVYRDVTDDIEKEQQLRHSQKMEAVGQLTGGLAHDFNNLLHVILGNADLLRHRMPGREPSLEAIVQAATRGAELTQRLLAFSRRQLLDIQTANVNTCIVRMLPLLESTLGATIAIETHLGEKLRHCRIDIAQLENCVLNLALNAQHAMPVGGRLVIETANVDLDDAFADAHSEVIPGEYVLVSVRDTGVGMSPEVAERVFEPFFTTREVGKGSGLGLSMVFGFMKQSQGHVTLSSEPGEGTCVSLYLPAAPASVEFGEEDRGARETRFQGRALVVEDDPLVSELTVELLASMGFEVSSARDARSAENLILTEPDFELLVTDVMLPGGANGPAIASSFQERFPDAGVVFMSGYTQNALAQGLLDEDAILLSKPFGRSDLIQKIAMVRRDAA